VIVQEIRKNEVEIAAVNPVASMMAVENEELTETANQVHEKLMKVIERII
jgi:hypothetical protein